MYNKNNETNKYFEFGLNKFGPLLYGYTKWLYKNIENKNYTKVFFFSRDGYMMDKAFSYFNKDKKIKTEYVYFSRKSIRQSLLHRCKSYEDSFKYLTWERFLSLGKILEYYGFSSLEIIGIAEKYNFDLNKDYDYKSLITNSDIKCIYENEKDNINKMSKNQEDLLKQYLRQIEMFGKCAIVDIGWHGSMQYYLDEFIKLNNLNVELDGYYLGINPLFPIKGECNGYLYEKNDLSLRKDVLASFGVLEKLFQSYEGSTHGYSKKEDIIIPILDVYEYKDNQNVVKAIEEWQKGALVFLKESKNKNAQLSNDKEWASELIKFGKSPSLADVKLFKFFYNTEGTRIYFISQKPLFKYKPKELIHSISNSPWKTGFMKSVFKIPFPYFTIYNICRK